MVSFAIGDIPLLGSDWAAKLKHCPDRGGTFTDVWASAPGRDDIVIKLLSVDPCNYDDAPAEGIRRVLGTISGSEIPRGAPIPKGLIHSIRMGTTVATNGEPLFLCYSIRNIFRY